MNVLFICSANVFRSRAAEACLRDYCQKNNLSDITVTSAGTRNNIYDTDEEIHPETVARLGQFGIDIKVNDKKELTDEIFNAADIAIAISPGHKEEVQKRYGKEIPLFNEIAYGLQSGVSDIDQSWRKNPEYAKNFIHRTVEYIHAATPSLAKNLKNFQ